MILATCVQPTVNTIRTPGCVDRPYRQQPPRCAIQLLRAWICSVLNKPCDKQHLQQTRSATKLAAVHLRGSRRLPLFISHIPAMPPQTPPPHKHHAIALLIMYHFTVVFGIMRLARAGKAGLPEVCEGTVMPAETTENRADPAHAQAHHASQHTEEFDACEATTHPNLTSTLPCVFAHRLRRSRSCCACARAHAQETLPTCMASFSGRKPLDDLCSTLKSPLCCRNMVHAAT